MNTVNIRFEISFKLDETHSNKTIEQIHQEIADSVKNIQNKYTPLPNDTSSPPFFHNEEDFFQFALSEIQNLKENTRFNTARNYQTAITSLKQYVKEPILPFQQITKLLIDNFENHLKNQGCHLNTISCYMRTLRAIYNKGVSRNLTTQNFPFQSVFTGSDQTRKRAIPQVFIRRLIQMDFSRSHSLQLTKDLFLFSFYSRGISFIDIAHLKHSNINGDYLTYYRHKTHQQLTVKLERPTKEILKRYIHTSSHGYLFPILKGSSPETNYQRYRQQLGLYNKRLNRISKLLGENCHLSSYVPRHTWATLAKEQGIPITIISESLGHTSEKTTRIYMKSLEKQTIDQANLKLIKNILRK